MVFNKFLDSIFLISFNQTFYAFSKYAGNSTTQKCSSLRSKIFSEQNKQNCTIYLQNSKKNIRLYLHRHGQYLSYLIPDFSTYKDKKR